MFYFVFDCVVVYEGFLFCLSFLVEIFIEGDMGVMGWEGKGVRLGYV